jgi:hypothetical protein
MFGRSTHPMVDHAAVVALGVATGVGSVLGAPSPAQATVDPAASQLGARTVAPAARPHAPTQLIDPSAACPGAGDPTDPQIVDTAPLRSVFDGSTVGQVALQYSPSTHCVRSVVSMFGSFDDCKLIAIVHKPATGDNTSTVHGAYGVSLAASDWVNDYQIEQAAVGFKSCQDGPSGDIVASGATDPY